MKKPDSPKFSQKPKRRFLPLLLAGVLGAGVLVQNEKDSCASQDSNLGAQKNRQLAEPVPSDGKMTKKHSASLDVEPSKEELSLYDRMLKIPEVALFKEEYCETRPRDFSDPKWIDIKAFNCEYRRDEPDFVGYTCDDIFNRNVGLRTNERNHKWAGKMLRESCEMAHALIEDNNIDVEECFSVLSECDPEEDITLDTLKEILREREAKKLAEREEDLEKLRGLNAELGAAALALQISDTGSNDIFEYCNELAKFRMYQKGGRRVRNGDVLRYLDDTERFEQLRLQSGAIEQARNKLRQDCGEILGSNSSQSNIEKCLKEITLNDTLCEKTGDWEEDLREYEVDELIARSGVNLSAEEAAQTIINEEGDFRMYCFAANNCAAGFCDSFSEKWDELRDHQKLVREDCKILLGDNAKQETIEACAQLLETDKEACKIATMSPEERDMYDLRLALESFNK
ncbi:MAG: hypothetical protein OEY44_01265 [Candidatus Peregrinibacteria bacterium]|nr:hypothetical protein [Candidatus Peregrinibacteria bacterium]